MKPLSRLFATIIFAVVPLTLFAAESDWDVLNLPRHEGPVAAELQCDVCIVGAGSAGSAAAIMAAREGADTILIERFERLGGTGTNAFIANWEPGPGCSLARELFERMKAIGGAGVGKSLPLQGTFPYGYKVITEGETYESTTHRTGVKDTRVVPFKPEAFDRVVRDLCAETKKVRILDKTVFFQSETNADRTRVTSVLVRNEKGEVLRIRAKVFIDSSGDVWLCRSLGCETMLGIDARSTFNEPSAPEQPVLQLNAITRGYEIARSANPTQVPAPQTPVAFPKAAYITGWKDGPLSVNMMPTLPGRTLIDLGYEETLRRSEEIVRAHWHWLQQCPDFNDFELVRIAPMLGIRESYRVKTKYVLNERDLKETLKNQKHKDMIAIADHPCDIHGEGGGLGELTYAYGVPYRCLVPEGELTNLLVSCRGAGFSRIAASSCRLHRTMIQLGHAAGIAAARAAKDDKAVGDIDAEALARELNAPARYDEYGKATTVDR